MTKWEKNVYMHTHLERVLYHERTNESASLGSSWETHMHSVKPLNAKSLLWVQKWIARDSDHHWTCVYCSILCRRMSVDQQYCCYMQCIWFRCTRLSCSQNTKSSKAKPFSKYVNKLRINRAKERKQEKKIKRTRRHSVWFSFASYTCCSGYSAITSG